MSATTRERPAAGRSAFQRPAPTQRNRETSRTTRSPSGQLIGLLGERNKLHTVMTATQPSKPRSILPRSESTSSAAATAAPANSASSTKNRRISTATSTVSPYVACENLEEGHCDDCGRRVRRRTCPTRQGVPSSHDVSERRLSSYDSKPKLGGIDRFRCSGQRAVPVV